MGLRTIGRWLYHTITSAEKRPYIKSSLESLELLTAEAADNRDVLLLFDVLDELKYRKTIPSKRDALTRKIISLIKEFEGISISTDAGRELIAKARKIYLGEVFQRAAEEKRRKASEAMAHLEAEAKAHRDEAERREAERKAKEAAAEQARLEAEAKAQREKAERQEAERKAKEAAAEQARLEAEAKAQREEAERKEAERKAKEAAAEQARLEAEAKAQREEAERKEAERKAKEAAAEQARLEAEAKAQREEAERKEAERNAKEAATEKARLEAEVRPMPNQDLNTSRQLEELAEADARFDAASESFSQTPLAKGITRRMSREEQKEERRELARLRRLERQGKTTDQSEDEPLKGGLDVEFEEAEQFAPYLRAIPAHWPDWSEQHWNIKLLNYCFVQKANENSNQGISSTEEDLALAVSLCVV
jgi:chemotaxis protein histidine kinase CheA